MRCPRQHTSAGGPPTTEAKATQPPCCLTRAIPPHPPPSPSTPRAHVHKAEPRQRTLAAVTASSSGTPYCTNTSFIKPSRKSKSTRAYATAGAAALGLAPAAADADSTPYTVDPTATTASSEGPPAAAQRAIKPAYSSLAAADGAPPRARIAAAAARSDASVSSPVDAIVATAGAAAVAVAMAGRREWGGKGRSAGETEARWRNSVLRWGQRVRNTTTERGGNLAEEGRRSRERQDVVVTPEERWIKAGRSSQAARVAGEDTAMRCERKGGQLHQSGQRGCVSADCAGRQPTASWGRVWAGRSPLVPSHDPVDAACRIRLGRPGPGSTARQVFHASFLQRSSSQLDAVLISIYLAAKQVTFNYVHTVTHIHKGQ